ncbi:MAG: HAD family hydrolase [Candidatus Micrarchaeota archaeon]|nr:HAD family hydrolase [Candidatus Micrarchaeota archaeon]
MADAALIRQAALHSPPKKAWRFTLPPMAEGIAVLPRSPQNSHDIKAIIFDIDGVLVESSALTANALKETLKRNGVAITQSQAIMAVSAGHDAKSILLAACPNLSHEPDLLSQLCSSLISATNATLHQLEPTAIARKIPILAKRFGLGVATNRIKSTAMVILEAIGALQHISVIMSLDDAEPKPSPQMLLFAIQKLQVPPDQAVFVGDKESDRMAGDKAGIRTIMVDASRGFLGCLPFINEFCKEVVL